MFQRILVPLDGSSRAEQALPLAMRIAHASGGTIILLTVVDSAREVFLQSRTPGPFLPFTTLEQDLAAAHNYLDQVSQRYEPVECSLEKQVDLGNPAQQILARAEAVTVPPVDLIVLFSRGRGYTGIKRWLLGSVAQKIARHSPVPVLILPDQEEPSASLFLKGTRSVRVLVSLDGSALAEMALAPALHLSWALSAPRPAHLHLIQIVPLGEPLQVTDISQRGEQRYEMISEAQAQAVTTATTYLQAVQQRAQREAESPEQLQMTSAVTVDPDVAAALLRCAEGNGGENGADMIAITTHGATGLSRWLVGSITERLLHATRLPLLVVRSLSIREQDRVP